MHLQSFAVDCDYCRPFVHGRSSRPCSTKHPYRSGRMLFRRNVSRGGWIEVGGDGNIVDSCGLRWKVCRQEILVGRTLGGDATGSAL